MVREVLEQLQAAGLKHEVQRMVLKKCSENFLEEMAEIIHLKDSVSFWKLHTKGKKKYYLDMLTHVYCEDLPTEALKRDVSERLNWLSTRKFSGEYLNEWKVYLA